MSDESNVADDRERGLYGKYRVERVDGKPVGCVFVLRPNSDPYAREALREYADRCRPEYPLLAADLDAWLEELTYGRTDALLVNPAERSLAIAKHAEAEVAEYEKRYPCDAGCTDYPEEDCSRHGRTPADLWGQIDIVRKHRDELKKQLAERDERLAYIEKNGAYPKPSGAWAGQITKADGTTVPLCDEPQQ